MWVVEKRKEYSSIYQAVGTQWRAKTDSVPALRELNKSSDGKRGGGERERERLMT